MYKKRIGWLAAVCLLFFGCPVWVRAETISLSSLSAVVYEPQTGRVLYEKDAHTPRAMASTTKLMTALIGAENVEMSREITATKEAVTVEGSSMGLHAGDKISMHDLLTGLLLSSGNDAANTIALTVSGSLPAFAEKMNQRAQELGMRESHFVTPSGLDAADHAASAYDMALLGAAVLRNPTLASICATKTATIELGDPKRKATISNHNRLLSLYSHCIGLKTGFTKKSGRCLVSAAQKDGVTLVVATLNGGDYWNDHIKLYEYGFEQVEACTLPTPVLPQLPVSNGETGWLPLRMETPESAIVPKGSSPSVTMTVELPRFVLAPVEAGETIGYVRYWLDGNELCAVPLQAAYRIEALPVAGYPQQVWRLFCRMLRELLW